MSIKIYHNTRCSKSRETLKLLQEKGHDPEIIEYLNDPPTVLELEYIVENLQQPANALIRVKEAGALDIEPRELGETEVIKLLRAHPEIMERPVVITEKGVRIGRPPELVLEIL